MNQEISMINKIFGKLGYVKKEQLEMLNTLIQKRKKKQRKKKEIIKNYQ